MPSGLDLTPEAALLLACINVSSTPQEKSQQIAALVRQPIDWDRFVLLVSSHNLASLVCPHLQPELGVPVQAFAPLRLLDLANIAKTQLYSAELARLIGLFTSAGIPTIVLKGPALSLLAYGNVSARDYSDLDILVHPSDVVSASELLIASGYGANTYNRQVYESGFFHNKSFNFMSDQFTVDLHWRTQDHAFPYGPDEETIWSQTLSLNINGQEIRTLGAADYLLYLSVHSAKHGWPTLGHVVDIGGLLTVLPELELCALVDVASKLHFRRMVLLALSLALRLAGAQLNGQALTFIERDKSAPILSHQLSTRLLAGWQPKSALNRWIVVSKMLESRSDRLRMFVVHCLTPVADDYARYPVPRSLYLLYYLMRPLRLAAALALSR